MAEVKTQESSPPERQRRQFRGIVTSAKMAKTIAVEVSRRMRHPDFEKYIRRVTILKAHDEEQKAKEGDEVEIEETRPLSRTKRWRLVRVVRAAGVDDSAARGLSVEAQSQARREAKARERSEREEREEKEKAAAPSEGHGKGKNDKEADGA